MIKRLVRLRNERGLSNEIGERVVIACVSGAVVAAVVGHWLSGWLAHLTGIAVAVVFAAAVIFRAARPGS